MNCLGLWCHDAAGVGGGLCKLVVVGGEVFGYIAGVVVDWHCIDGAAVRAEALTSALVGEGCR
jgi:hypothetical protein